MIAEPPIRREMVDGLSLSLIISSHLPVLLLDANLRVLAGSTSFCTAFGIAAADIRNRPLNTLGTGEWSIPQLLSLLSATASGNAEIEAYEVDFKRLGEPVRHLVMNARKLDYLGEVRLLLTIADETASRASEVVKDDLVRDKGVLLRELQHRVANSLQIIASVLMQSARKTNSAETRGHLRDAHSRVMSVAAVQRQLAVTTLDDVRLRPYFTELCNSIGASMIHDHDQLSLEVVSDDASVGAEASVSLGLIVTELVINSLKHAFPNLRAGKIQVSYRTKGEGWTLAVSDNGIGMPRPGAEASKPGLGTGIVEALAKQLRAGVSNADAHPGTIVSIIHLAPVAEEQPS